MFTANLIPIACLSCAAEGVDLEKNEEHETRRPDLKSDNTYYQGMDSMPSSKQQCEI